MRQNYLVSAPIMERLFYMYIHVHTDIVQLNGQPELWPVGAMMPLRETQL